MKRPFTNGEKLLRSAKTVYEYHLFVYSTGHPCYFTGYPMKYHKRAEYTKCSRVCAFQNMRDHGILIACLGGMLLIYSACYNFQLPWLHEVNCSVQKANMADKIRTGFYFSYAKSVREKDSIACKYGGGKVLLKKCWKEPTTTLHCYTWA